MMVMTSAMLLVTAFLAFSSATDVGDRDARWFINFFNFVRLNPVSRIVIGWVISVPVAVIMPDLGIWGRHSRSYTTTWPFQETSPMCSAHGTSIKDYLHLLQIDLEPCQELFICEVASDPNKYMPLSEILLKKLSANKWMKNPRFSHMINSTEYNLVMAAQSGLDVNRECNVKYWDCPVDAKSMINMNLLSGIQYLLNTLDIRFVGETDVGLQNN